MTRRTRITFSSGWATTPTPGSPPTKCSTPRTRGVRTVGVVSLDVYEKWDGKRPEGGWCGDISGQGIVTIDVAEENWNGRRPKVFREENLRKYVRVGWVEDSVRENLGEFIDEVRRLKELHGEVRYVFGFDS